MKNKIKGIILIRENTEAAPKMLKVNGFILFVFKVFLVFLFVSTIVLVTGWTFIFQRLIAYSDIQIQNDSLIQHAKQIDSLKVNILKINRHLEYFKMVSMLDNKETPPTIDEFLKDADLIASFELTDAHREFKKIPRIRPVTGVISRNFDLSIPHEAIDFVAPQGSPIRATAEGEVIKVYVDGDLGNVVVLKHVDGYETLYAHSSEILVKVGQSVVQGETIALVGSSGAKSSGNHLHYEVSKDGKIIDPNTLFL